MIDKDKLDTILFNVKQPGQYTGGEWNAIVKPLREDLITLALAFPDTYAIGMSNLGMQVLYGLANVLDYVSCQRVYAPQRDFERKLKSNNIPLYALENKTPLKDFDVVGFSLQYELSYTNVLQMLDLGGIPLKSNDRSDTDPIVIAGGPCAYAPEPMADFFDIFLVGDGEKTLPMFLEKLKELKDRGVSRRKKIEELARAIPAAYAPQLYEVLYTDDGERIETMKPISSDIAFPIEAAWIDDLESAFHPVKPVVPYISVVHDRIALELMRGCIQGCRFCQAGFVKRPIRLRKPETVIELLKDACRNTGYDELSLLSLSTCDYPGIYELMDKLNQYFKSKRVNISLPSFRVGENLRKLPKLLKTVRKSGITIALEAGSESLRRTINKKIDLENLYAGVIEAYKAGWDLIKLYCMIGLPGETDEDLDEIVYHAEQLSQLRREINKSPGKINLSLSSFIPKPHTPFQWKAMVAPDELRRRQEYIKKRIKNRKIRVKTHDVNKSYLEGVFTRGDRRLSSVILEAYKRGARFDGWTESFSMGIWRESFEACGIDSDSYVLRKRGAGEFLPWSHIKSAVSNEFLAAEKNKADSAEDYSYLYRWKMSPLRRR